MKLRPRFARSLATAASLALAGCTAVGAAPLDMPALAATPPVTPAPAPAPAAAPSGPALWKVADEDTTIYLFGTVHFLPETADWFVPRRGIGAGRFGYARDRAARRRAHRSGGRNR